ncbi:MAG: transglutaminase family protein [Deltaproteobacteria bacterium]|nr:transglutaminase family protein [Deltaproteobacteria bacterium]
MMLSERETESYLAPTFAVDSDNPRILETARRLTDGCQSDPEKAARLFSFVRDEIHYNVYMVSVFVEDFMASRVLEWGKGYCVQKAVLLAALGRAAGIPSRLAFAMIRNHRLPAKVREWAGTDTFPRHGYNQFFLNGGWVSAAAPFDRNLCEKSGLPLVEFDGHRDAVLPERDVKGEPFIEYLEKYPPRQDLPFDWIVERLRRIVGPDKRPWLNRDQARESQDG